MKKEVKVVISVILAIWLFVMGIEIGAYREKTKIAETTTTAPIVVTTTESTTAQTTTETTTQATTESTTAASTTVVDVNATTSQTAVENTTTTTTLAPAGPTTLSKEEIVAEVAKAVNAAKQEQNFTAVKDESIEVEIVDISVSFLRNTVNSVIKSLTGDGPTQTNYTFTNGLTSDGKSPHGEIPPCGKDFTLPAEGVKEAKMEKVGDTTVYTLTIVEEHTTKDAGVPQYNSQAIGYLDLASIADKIPFEITTANMHYPGSTVEVTVDANGKLTKLVNKLPMSGEGAVSAGSASFEGGLDETWVFTY